MSASNRFPRLFGGNALGTDCGEHVHEQDPQTRETGGVVLEGNFIAFGTEVYPYASYVTMRGAAGSWLHEMPRTLKSRTYNSLSGVALMPTLLFN